MEVFQTLASEIPPLFPSGSQVPRLYPWQIFIDQAPAIIMVKHAFIPIKEFQKFRLPFSFKLTVLSLILSIFARLCFAAGMIRHAQLKSVHRKGSLS